jgi:hypothetical protein
MKSARVLLAAAFAAACCLAAPAARAQAGTAPSPLRHAITVPAFKGESDRATAYRDALLQRLRECPRVELIPYSRRVRPVYTYRVDGRILGEGKEAKIEIKVTDLAREEVLFTSVLPAATAEDLAAWEDTASANIARASAVMPFECAVTPPKKGTASYVIDRGLAAGIYPGLVLDIAVEEDPLIDPDTGDVIGRHSKRSFGKIQIFRVGDQSSYGRSIGEPFPESAARFVAREF